MSAATTHAVIDDVCQMKIAVPCNDCMRSLLLTLERFRPLHKLDPEDIIATRWAIHRTKEPRTRTILGPDEEPNAPRSADTCD